MKNQTLPLFTRFWVLCLVDGATSAGLAPAARPQLFALAYLANAVAEVFNADAIQRAVLRQSSGPTLSDVAVELDRLVGLGLCDVARLVGTKKSGVLKSEYFVSERGRVNMEAACSQSSYLAATREFHHLVAAGFSDLGLPHMIEGSKAEASYSDLEIGEDEVVDLGEFKALYPTLEAIAVVERALPRIRDKSAFGLIQVYGRYLAQAADKTMSAEVEVVS